MGRRDDRKSKRRQQSSPPPERDGIDKLRKENAALNKLLHILYPLKSADQLDHLLQLANKIVELESYVEYLKERVAQRERDLPMHILFPDELEKDLIYRKEEDKTGKWLGTVVGICLFFRDDNSKEYLSFVGDGHYPGTREEALNTIAAYIYNEVVVPIPCNADIPKIPTGFEILTDADVRNILADLAPLYWYDKPEFERRRLEIFQKDVWPHLDIIRHEAIDKYDKFIKSAFDRLEARLAKYRQSQE